MKTEIAHGRLVHLVQSLEAIVHAPRVVQKGKDMALTVRALRVPSAQNLGQNVPVRPPQVDRVQLRVTVPPPVLAVLANPLAIKTT